MHRSKGFTLLEIMVALTVLALALSAAVTAVGRQAADAGYLRDKTYAHWVGMNRVAEIQLSKTWPDVGRQNGDEELATQRWFWLAEVKETPDPDTRRLEVQVRLNEEDETPLANLTAYLPRPPE